MTRPSIRGLRISIDHAPARDRSSTVSRTASASHRARTSADDARFGLTASSAAQESTREASRAAVSSSGASSNRILIAGCPDRSPKPAGRREVLDTSRSMRRCSRHNVTSSSRKIARCVSMAARSPLADSAIAWTRRARTSDSATRSESGSMRMRTATGLSRACQRASPAAVRTALTADCRCSRAARSARSACRWASSMSFIALRAASFDPVKTLSVGAGDVFDTAAPTPESQALVMRALLALREDGRKVVVVAGNHDNPHLLDVYRPVLGALGMHVVGTFRRPHDGGVLTFNARTGEPVRLAAVPFLSHRYAVRAAEALTGSPDEHNRTYADNLVPAHGTLPGGKFVGGEREAQSIYSYYFEPTAFPPSTQYAALGHLHRRQQVPGPCPIWSCGSPIAVDVGEEDNTPGAPAGHR